MKTAVIIDDIESARKSLKDDIEHYCSSVEIVGEAEGVVSGAKVIRETKPDIIFLDIQMNDGSGFDLLEILPELDSNVIFTTASDQYAIKAFKFSAIDYLLKPIDPDDLVKAVDKASKESDGKEKLEILRDNFNSPKKLALNTLEKIHIANIQDIVRCESNVNYTMFYFSDNSKILVTKTLKEYDKMLTPQGFLRPHQSHLINLEFVKEFVKLDGGYIVMKDGAKVPVSTRKRPEVMDILSNL
ncbi:MAG: response regulator transcription factor [Crocinitomicaceae bacterium]|nr:response regulator transcription factor [Crocinitomicaceae bacterium]